MPPKIARRPAANVGRLRRPAAAVVPPPPGVGVGLRHISAGEWLGKGRSIFQGRYWDEPVQWAGQIEGLVSVEGEPFLKIRVEGTDSERLLKWLSGQEPKVVRAHLCEDPCTALVWSDEVCHLTKVDPATEGSPAWTKNLLPVGDAPGGEEDELR